MTNVKKLILMQGAPGCGKSSMAAILNEHYLSRGLRTEVHSADTYWYKVIDPGQPDTYSFDPSLSGKNHVWNQHNVLEAMESQIPVIIVDNTNTLRKEAAPYITLASMFGYEIMAVRVDPGVEECVKRNAARPEDRRVPEDVVRAMHARMENLLPLFA